MTRIINSYNPIMAMKISIIKYLNEYLIFLKKLKKISMNLVKLLQ